MDLLKKGTVFAFALSAVSSVAWADGAAVAGEQDAAKAAGIAGEVSFEEADLDDSGVVDATEAQELGLEVVRFDTNYNGVIDRTEWERAPEQATEADAADRSDSGMRESGAIVQSAADASDLSFEEADLDDSGFVEAPEMEQLGLDLLVYDMNYNGIIEPVEWERAPKQATEAGAAAQMGASTETRESGAAVQSAADASGISFKEADLDDSGFVEAPEMKELGLDLLVYDMNYNGIIDPVEWERAPEQATDPGRNTDKQ